MRFAVAISALAAAVVLLACSNDGGGTDLSASPSISSSADPAPSSPPASRPAQSDEFLIYREASGNLVARNVATDESYTYVVDFNNEVIVDAGCSADGSRMAFVRQPFSSRERQLDIHGEGAPAEPISLPSTTQAFAWSPDGARMAFVRYEGIEQAHTVVVMDVASGNEEELTSGPDFAGSPTFSPDGSRIAYYIQRISDGDTQVFTIPTGGGDPEQVSSGDLQWYDPNWSPDGSKLLVAGLRTEDFQLYEIDPESGETSQLTESDIFKRGAKYSPGGELIAYTGSIVLAQVAVRPSASLHSFGIFLLNADGSDERAFTADPRLNPGAAVDPYLDANFIGWCTRGPWLDDTWTPFTPTTAPPQQ